jgi:hypothetical protein
MRVRGVAKRQKHLVTARNYMVHRAPVAQQQHHRVISTSTRMVQTRHALTVWQLHSLEMTFGLRKFQAV